MNVVILQNYFTPYRHALFDAMAAELDALTVVHSRRPEQDGRKWQPEVPTRYSALSARSTTLGPLVFFALPRQVLRDARRKTFVLHDDNPANLAMIFWTAWLRLSGARTLLWSEHIPGPERGLKTAYQRGCSWLLQRMVHQVIAFSDMTSDYVRALAPSVPIERMLQSVPQPAATPGPRSGSIRRFGFIGSDQPRKNLDALLTAFATLEGAELHVAGVPPRNADPRITWWGYVDGERREQFFASIDMLVLPSLKEPWGLVANEALDRGALAMVSNRCGSREMVETIDPHLVFEPTAEAIGVTLQHWLGRPIEAFSMKAAAVAGSYSTTAAARRFIEILGGARR